MTYKNLIKTILLTILLIPSVGFAETKLNTKPEKEAIQENIQTPEEMKAQADKNRKERINHALDALGQNISNVEKGITQILTRASGIDKNTKGLGSIISDLEKNKVKLAETKQKIADAKVEVKSIDTTNKDQIKAIADKIEVIKKETRENISSIIVSIKPMKTMPLSLQKDDSAPKVIQKEIKSPIK